MPASLPDPPYKIVRDVRAQHAELSRGELLPTVANDLGERRIFSP
jgi:hypothetical protein